MIRPGLANFVIGHWLGVTLTTSVALFTAAAWATQEQRHESISWFVPAVALLLCKASVKARRRVAQYRNWRDAWHEMAGASPPQRKRATAAWRLIGFATWLALLCWLVPHQAEKTNESAFLALVWLLLSLWGVVAVVGALARRAFRPRRQSAAARPARPKAEREHIVSVCLPVPWTSPRATQLTASLPAYCQPLLSAGAAAASISGESSHARSPGK
jgi:hypothetical protein